MLNLQPTYKKFGATSPQFATVGKAMFDAWFADGNAISNRRQFTTDDISELMEYMWHNEQHLKGIIIERDRKIDELHEELKKLTKTSEGKTQ